MTTHEPCRAGCGMLADECECPSPNPFAGFTVDARTPRRVLFPRKLDDPSFKGRGAAIARGFREGA